MKTYSDGKHEEHQRGLALARTMEQNAVVLVATIAHLEALLEDRDRSIEKTWLRPRRQMETFSAVIEETRGGELLTRWLPHWSPGSFGQALKDAVDYLATAAIPAECKMDRDLAGMKRRLARGGVWHWGNYRVSIRLD